ncbi:hypothetical protein DID88_004729 [Monilinia fructigena]|uniref:Zn(2)-C6 fungal-type domain-containing protein n=1 Tax=Monilinia fructigena TaxID=38457 RepID=A0A395ITB6_9HELO|nr:hypothetical protein DID88_004729 [Monilinia fructigena]
MNSGHSGSKTPSQIACLTCRSVKLKCKATALDEKCERCKRKSLECVFEQHRRGRKPGTRIKRTIKRDNVQIRSAPSSEQTNLLPNTIHEGDRTVGPNPQPSGQVDTSAPDIAQSWGNDGLQQVGILSREAQFGKFSLENILSVPDVLKPQPAPTKSPTHGADNFNDPITWSEWYQEKYAVPGGDMVLSAFVCLRLISAEMLELASSMKLEAQKSRTEILSKFLNTEISTWEKDWLSKFEDETVGAPQRFLVNFYGSHLRLLLNSYSLQHSLKSAKKGGAISKSALWQCSASAIGMLDNISNVIGPLKQLYFVQDSVHVMTAYAAIFLIKLLVALPKNLRSDLEAQSLQAILLSSETFSQQCATQMTGCAMQARFLKNLAEKYQSLKSQASIRNRDRGIHSCQSNIPISRDGLQNRMNTDINNDHQAPEPISKLSGLPATLQTPIQSAEA